MPMILLIWRLAKVTSKIGELAIKKEYAITRVNELCYIKGGVTKK